MSTITPRAAIAFATAVLAITALAGCTAPAADETEESGTATSTPAPDYVLATADSALGEIVVDGDGMTVYVFDKDTQGATSSACLDTCATTWPAVPGDDTAAVDGVDGELGTITGTDGEPQLTLDGWPLYYFASDAAAGDVAGQAVNGIWWVIAPDGTKITTVPAS